jgi:uncharacterized membrane-anchored protein YhcB (DUF1043 family)
MSWVPSGLSLLSGLKNGTTLINLFNAIAREFKRLEDEIEDLKRKVG